MKRLFGIAVVLLTAVASGDKVSTQASAITIDRFAIMSADRSTVTLTGTFVCRADEEVVVTAALSVKGQSGPTCDGGLGQGCPYLACTAGAVESYSVTLSGGGISPGPGNAEVDVASADHTSDYVAAFDRVIVRPGQ